MSNILFNTPCSRIKSSEGDTSCSPSSLQEVTKPIPEMPDNEPKIMPFLRKSRLLFSKPSTGNCLFLIKVSIIHVLECL